MRYLLVTAIVVAGCSKGSDCERAVHHVFELTTHAGPKGSEPKHDEKEMIDTIEKTTIGACEREGLSAEQRDCILGMKTFDDMKAVSNCAAIKAKHPSWLLTGPAHD
jgi:hypothetical protein